MMIPYKIYTEFQILLTKSLDDVIAEPEIERINEILTEYPEMSSFYHKYISLKLTLRQCKYFSIVDPAQDSFTDMLIALVKQEKTAPSINIPIKAEEKPPIVTDTRKANPQPVKTSKAWPLLAATCAVILMLIILTAQYQRWSAPVEVATITDLLNAKVEGRVLTPLLTRLSNKSAPISLTAGVVKIKFDCGVDTIIEGPALFEIQSTKHISLSRGKLYAQVSETGRGFRVDTPGASIVDLGTEFGVHVPRDRSSRILMVKGRATVASRLARKQFAPQVITEGQARRVSSSGDMHAIEIERTAFVRDFDSVAKTFWRGSVEWLTIVSLPAQDTDQASGIHPDKTYTHLLDFGLGEAATINGVVFSPVDFTEPLFDMWFQDESLDFILTRTGGVSLHAFQNEYHGKNADGGIQTLLSDCIFLSNQFPRNYYALTLTGLIPGQTYSLRLYYSTDQREPERSNRLIFNGEGHSREITVDQQAGGARYVRYDYTAARDRVQVIFQPQETDRSWHLYGLSNEVITIDR